MLTGLLRTIARATFPSTETRSATESLNCGRDSVTLSSSSFAFAKIPPMNASVPHHRPLGQILITKGILSEDQLRIALLEQLKSNQPVGKLLVSLGFVSEATLRDALSESLGKQSIDLSSAIVDPSALAPVSYTHLDVYKRQVPRSLRGWKNTSWMA